MKRRTLLLSAVAAAGVPGSARAEAAYPSQTIRLIHGYDAGSNPDTIARHLAPGLTENLGVQIVIEPKPGAAERLAAAPAGLPPAVMARLHEAIVQVTARPEVRDRLQELGNDTRVTTPAAFRARVEADLARWRPLARVVQQG